MQRYPYLMVLCLLIPLTCTAQQLLLPRMRKSPSGMANRFLNTKNPITRKKVLLIHNYYRSKVEPKASNMLQAKWHRGAQNLAQKWADQCRKLIHDRAQDRYVPNYGSCGQNLYVSPVRKDWLTVVKDWFDERNDFTYGANNNNLVAVGHYTQMIWYSSYRLGCAYAYCNNTETFYNYVCNYCPIGNERSRLGRPYETGRPCEKCPGKCKYGTLCTNSCRYVNLWSNCKDLMQTNRDWVCGDRESEPYKNCKAVCKCQDAIM